MHDEDLFDLIEKEISGRLSEEERGRLDSLLENDPEAHTLRQHVLETSEILNGVKDLETPSGLKDRIMSSIDTGRYGVETQAPARSSVWRALFKPRLKLAYAFAAGLLAGLLLYSQVVTIEPGGPPVDHRQLYGTIASLSTGELREIETVRIEAAEARGEVRLLGETGLLAVECDLVSRGDFEVVLGFNPEGLRFEGLSSPMTPAIRVVSSEGSVTVAVAEQGRYVVFLVTRDGKPVTITVSVDVSGESVYRHEFSVPVEAQ